MRTTTPARVVRPAALIAAIVVIAGAVACGDVAAPSAPPQVVSPGADAAFSGYALASGKTDSTSTQVSSKGH